MLNNEKSQDGLIKVPQREGDIVYFGIHDLSKYYRENQKLPYLELYDIFAKKGEILSIDTAKHEVVIAVDKSPFQFGYRKIDSNNKQKNNKIEIKIPLHYLQDITHLTDGDLKIYLVIDGNTKYQKKLIDAIRRKEIKKSKQKPSPKTRHYDDNEGEDFCVDDDEDEELSREEMHVAHFNPSILSKSHSWKIFNETKSYKYFPKLID